jgi:uncharacterized protein
MQKVQTTIQEYIEAAIIPLYTNFDKAHNLDHVNSVIAESIVLAKNFEVNINMVYVIAAYHDLGLAKDRETHHLISGEILIADNKLKEWFSVSEIEIMKEAIEDHRASSKLSPRSIYGRIISEADRDIEPIKIIQRTLQYAMKHYPNRDKDFYCRAVFEHLQEKYSESGYIKLWLKESKNAENLAKLRAIIKNEIELNEIFEQLYLKETELVKY